MPYAFVKLNIDGEDFIGTDYGVGPVDAALNAIQKITGKVPGAILQIQQTTMFND